MKLVIYDEENNVVEIHENIRSPVVNGQDVQWEDGSMTGIKLPFLLLEDDVLVEGRVDEALISQDKKENFPLVDLEEENKILKDENKMNAMAVMELAEMIFGGMG